MSRLTDYIKGRCIVKWQDKLTKKELKHLRVDANCHTLAAVKRTVEVQEADRKRNNHNPVIEPCWECKEIGRKLGLIE